MEDGSRAAVGILPAGGDLSNLRVMKTWVQLQWRAEAWAGPEWGSGAPGSGIRTFKLSGQIRERPDYLARKRALWFGVNYNFLAASREARGHLLSCAMGV